ncbi:MAG: sialate O-acetylesterase, partial [Clostridia bacterium]
MFYGVQISSGLSDWQVLQRHEGVARVVLAGRWRLEAGAVRAGVQSVTPVLRVVSEQDQSLILPWTACDSRTEDGVNGEWEITATLPQGGPYRVETSLEAVSSQNGDHWMFRGDIRVHVGVGDLFCMAGQSNAAGYAKGEAFDPPDPRVRLLRNSGRWDMAAHPMNDATDAADCVNAPMGITGTSPFLSFGRRYADAAAVPVGLIQAAQGGSPMARWDMRRCGDLLRSMLDRMDACGGVCAILWYQGCAD